MYNFDVERFLKIQNGALNLKNEFDQAIDTAIKSDRSHVVL